ncbi:DUF2027 domain-containing protein [Roseivirga sp. BDSF3-8]|uniref:DUF2027 domain-containing protein n=1 Tax=Roseivirga sp. BDSF3-8 TaxID=3241598 RepID=UPI00353275BB
MNIGDRVRMMKGSEEGIVVRFLPNALVEVEIEDGFQIPVLKRELVVISSQEDEYFGSIKPKKEPETAKAAPKVRAESGLYLAFPEVNDKVVAAYLINNTDYDIAISLSEEKDGNISGLRCAILSGRGQLKFSEYELSRFDKWPIFLIQAIFHQTGNFTPKDPMFKRVRFKANTFFKSKRPSPVIEKEAYLIQLDAEIKPVDAGKLKDSLFTGSSSEPARSEPLRVPEKVDLHIEALTNDKDNMSNRQMLELQLSTFEDMLDKAIVAGKDEITFIHGLGNGTLKNAIQKKLSTLKNIKYFEDTMKDKFGYGATRVQIK